MPNIETDSATWDVYKTNAFTAGWANGANLMSVAFPVGGGLFAVEVLFYASATSTVASFNLTLFDGPHQAGVNLGTYLGVGGSQVFDQLIVQVKDDPQLVSSQIRVGAGEAQAAGFFAGVIRAKFLSR